MIHEGRKLQTFGLTEHMPKFKVLGGADMFSYCSA